MLGSSAYWGNLVLAIPIGWWASRFSPKILTSVTLALGTLFLLAQSITPGFALLILSSGGLRRQCDRPATGARAADPAMVPAAAGGAGEQHLQRHVRPGGGWGSSGFAIYSRRAELTTGGQPSSGSSVFSPCADGTLAGIRTRKGHRRIPATSRAPRM